jgi:glycosyltransferase involved in cell wall biosynthesis
MKTELEKICFISEKAYPVLTNSDGIVGGAELQVKYISNELGGQFDVYVITISHNGTQIIKKGNITIINIKRSKRAISLALLVQLFRIIYEINPTIIFHRPPSLLGIIISLIFKCHNTKYVPIISSNFFVERIFSASLFSDIIYAFYYIMLILSDGVICQTKHQFNLLPSHIKYKSTIIANIVSSKFQKDIAQNGCDILWMGKIVPYKNPLLIYSIAKRFPNLSFLILGGAPKKYLEYYNVFIHNISKEENITHINNYPHQFIFSQIKRTKLLISTSISEGFPNTFLESWYNGIPVISYKFDPDGLISRNELGVVCNTLEEICDYVEILLSDDDKYIEYSNNSHIYVNNHHSMREIYNKYTDLISSLI